MTKINIFILDYNPVLAAQYQADKHVVKMCLETAQLLSTVGMGPYKPTHISHPCTLWTGRNRTNFNWLIRHGLALCEEYTYRYGRQHKCQAVIEQIDRDTPRDIFPIGVSSFVQCMPDQYKHTDPVTAYRRYYHSKSDFAVWSKRPAPFWWNDETYLR